MFGQFEVDLDGLAEQAERGATMQTGRGVALGMVLPPEGGERAESGADATAGRIGQDFPPCYTATTCNTQLWIGLDCEILSSRRERRAMQARAICPAFIVGYTGLNGSLHTLCRRLAELTGRMQKPNTTSDGIRERGRISRSPVCHLRRR